MSETARTLHLYYRHVHIKADKQSRDPNKSRPAWFSHQRCFENLLRTIRADPQGDRVVVTVMYDGTVDDLLSDFMLPYVADDAHGVRLQFIKAGSDRDSFLITISHARQIEMPPTDLIYMLENDYVHQAGWVGKVFELYASGLPFDVVSLYDHKDKYLLEMYAGLTARLVVSPSHHWRTAPSTCGSFLLSRAALERDFDIYTGGKPDFHLFTDLIEGRQRTLLTPLPGLSTHSMAGYESPSVDWARLVA